MALWQTFLSYHGRLQISRPYQFYQGHLGRETGLLSTRFRFRNFSLSDERGSVIRDYFYFNIIIKDGYEYFWECKGKSRLPTVLIRWSLFCFSLMSGWSYVRLYPKRLGTSIDGPTSDSTSFLNRLSAHVLWPAERVLSCAHADNDEARRGIWAVSPSVSSLKSAENQNIMMHFHVHQL